MILGKTFFAFLILKFTPTHFHKKIGLTRKNKTTLKLFGFLMKM